MLDLDMSVAGGSSRHRPTVSMAALVLAVGACVSSVAHATTFVTASVDDLARASDLVVTARVGRVDVFERGPAGQPVIHTRATVEVHEVLSGELHSSLLEVWVHGGRVGDRLRVVPRQATFAPGEECLLFLFYASGGHYPTGMSRGKWTRDSRRPDAFLRPTEGVSGPTTLSLSDLSWTRR